MPQKQISFFDHMKKTEIIICLGSSCFSRGNDKILEIIKQYIQLHSLKKEVDFKGHLCMEECKNGPVVKINGEMHKNLNQESIIEILNSYFNIKE